MGSFRYGETPDDVVTGFFVGYTRHEYEPRPTLLWASGGVLKGEDLDPPDLRY